jgi:hypothetical protein
LADEMSIISYPTIENELHKIIQLHSSCQIKGNAAQADM